MSDVETGFSLLRKNLRRALSQFRKNLGLEDRKILRGRFGFQPTAKNEPQYEEPQLVTVKQPANVEVVEEEDKATGRLIRTFYRNGKKIKTEIVEAEFAENSPSEPSSVNVVQEEAPPLRPLQRFRREPTILGSLREIFSQSAEQVRLKTVKERLKIEALRKQIEQQQSKPKKEEQESKSVHY
ncbi:MAG: hypothetical protein DRO36_06150 [Candidatus Hecatellales archaeon]|nr:MAG: hypothetical protein DRO36_06150 [Candidatus Hecatellales archaeon]